MTYLLRTLNKRIIEVDKSNQINSLLRIGECSIPTNKFCENFAKLVTGENSIVIQTEKKPIFMLYNTRTQIVTLDQYEISNDNFNEFAKYVFRGGFYGWDVINYSGKPAFVKNSQEYIQNNLKTVLDSQQSCYAKDVDITELLK